MAKPTHIAIKRESATCRRGEMEIVVGTYPVSPVTGVIAIRLAVEFLLHTLTRRLFTDEE